MSLRVPSVLITVIYFFTSNKCMFCFLDQMNVLHPAALILKDFMLLLEARLSMMQQSSKPHK